jgi:hypothetical protein
MLVYNMTLLPLQWLQHGPCLISVQSWKWVNVKFQYGFFLEELTSLSPPCIETVAEVSGGAAAVIAACHDSQLGLQRPGYRTSRASMHVPVTHPRQGFGTLHDCTACTSELCFLISLPMSSLAETQQIVPSALGFEGRHRPRLAFVSLAGPLDCPGGALYGT